MRRFTLVTAALALGVAAIVTLTRGLFEHPDLRLALLALAALPFVLDVRYPSERRSRGLSVAAIVVVLAATTALVLAEPGGRDIADFLFVVLAARVAAEAPTSFGIGVAVVAMALPALLAAVGLAAPPANLLVGTAFAWFAGYEVRSQQRLAAQLVMAQSALADQVAATERQRIAREVHDLVAHTLSITMLHLTGARLSLEDSDVDEARTALLQAEKAGREALREMRQAVGLLGTPSTGSALPGAEDLPELIAAYRDAGLRLAFELQGHLDSVSGDAGLALYRIAQESLSNAAKHAPTAEALVKVSVGSTDVRLTVRNEVPGPSPVPRGGRGLPGMAQRAQVLGGSFTAGPVGDAWEVHAVLPGAHV